MVPSATSFEVNSFWGGAPLTRLELLSFTSFVQNGARYNLYSYDDLPDLPEGVTLRDAREILPIDRVFNYPAGTLNQGSPSGFTNLFRYTLLQRCGGWWVDSDVCCLGPFDGTGDEFYLREETQTGEFLVASCIFQAPAASSVLDYCLQAFAQKDVAKVVHGETGPTLLTEAIRTCGREEAVRPGAPFFPVPWWEYERLFFDEELSLERCRAVHFWNTMLRTARVDKDGDFPSQSVFERLKRRYL